MRDEHRLVHGSEHVAYVERERGLLHLDRRLGSVPRSLQMARSGSPAEASAMSKGPSPNT
jgi:hypothetical protein